MDNIWKKAAKKSRKREKNLLAKQSTLHDDQTATKSTPSAATSSPAESNTTVPETYQPSTPTTGTVKTVAELDARFRCMQEKWAQTSTGPLPEAIRNAVMEFRAALVIQEAAAAQPLGAPVYNIQVSEGGSREEGEGKEDGKKAEEARVEVISDEERERRRKRNEKTRKRKAEKEKEKERERESTKEQVNAVRTVPDNSNDTPSSRAPTGHVNPPTEYPHRPSTTVPFTGDVAPATVQANGNEVVRGIGNPGKVDTKEVRTMIDTTSDDTKSPAPSSFNWADDVDTTVVPVALIAPIVCVPRDFSGLRSSIRNPWSSLSRRHRRSHPRENNICNSFSYSIHNYAQKPPTAPTPPSKPAPPVPIQLVETIRHPRGIGPTKPVIKTSSPVRTPNSSPMSTSPREPLVAVGLDSSSRPPRAFSLDWSGDPLLAGLARVLEVLGWTRDRERRGRRYV